MSSGIENLNAYWVQAGNDLSHPGYLWENSGTHALAWRGQYYSAPGGYCFERSQAQGSVGVLARSSGTTSLGGAPIVPPLFYSKDVATFPTLMLFTD